MNLGRD